jgi:ABC-2 type transport system ATP-binding protein
LADGGPQLNGGAAWAEPVMSVSGLTKSFGDVEAVRGIDFEVARGETFGFLGPNGAGKTTTIKILCTLTRASSGHAMVAGHDSTTEQDDVRRNIGLVFQDTTLDTYLTAAQNLRFHAALYSVPKPVIEPRMRQVLTMVGLWDRKDSLVSTFSGGMQRRLEIARGLLHAPHVLFLDEPTVGLDPQTRSSIWAYINTSSVARTSPSSSRPTTWTRPSTVIGSPSSTTARSSPLTRPRR